MSVSILRGDCRAMMRTLEADSVHCVVTSPPYWGLRDYGVEPTVWGGDTACKHEWTERRWYTEQSAAKSNGSVEAFSKPGPDNAARLKDARWGQAATCGCGAWRDAFGLEPTYQMFVANAVEVFREVRRVLRPDGTLWLNIGDSYATGAGTVGQHPGGGKQGDAWAGHRGSRGGSAKQPHTGSAIGPMTQPNRMPQVGLKPKDLCGIPWRLAFALQDDGWYLRQDLIWAKPNPMPESVQDRCTKAHEYLFLLSKSARYHFDAEAIKETPAYSGLANQDASGFKDPRSFNGKHKDGYNSSGRPRPSGTQHKQDAIGNNQGGYLGSNDIFEKRNKRSVWEIPTAPFPGAHFATFPPALIEPCILAGCPEFTCSKCGTVLDKSIKDAIRSNTNGHALRSLSRDLSEATIAPKEEQILQPQVHGSSADADASNSGMRMVREAGDAGPQGQTAPVLQQGVRVPMDGQKPQHEQGSLHHVEGLRRDLHAGPSECDEGRLRDGASAGDGDENRSAATAERDRASSKRHSAREPREQSGSASQVRTRQVAEGENGQGVLPALQRHNNAVQTCPRCQANLALVGAIVPGTVLDPFGGAGTTGLVADRMGRDAILIELNPDYAAMAERRIKGDAGLFASVETREAAE